MPVVHPAIYRSGEFVEGDTGRELRIADLIETAVSRIYFPLLRNFIGGPSGAPIGLIETDGLALWAEAGMVGIICCSAIYGALLVMAPLVELDALSTAHRLPGPLIAPSFDSSRALRCATGVT